MKISLLCLLSLLCLTTFSQTCGLMLYTDNGEKFKVYTNGTLRNATAQNEIKICGFPSDIVKVRLEFEDHSRLEKTMYLRMGVIEHHRLSRKAGGAWSITFDSDENIPNAYQNMQFVTVIQGTTVIQDMQPMPRTMNVVSSTHNCGLPLSDRSFDEFWGYIKRLTFEADRLKEAKDAVRRGCFSSFQIKNLLAAFDYESSRVDFAKFAYDFAFDKGAYGIVKEGFVYRGSRDELDAYLGTR